MVKQPEDHKTSQVDIPDEYTHTFPDGGQITVPTMQQVPFGVIRKIRSLTEAEQGFQLIELLCDEDALKVIDRQVQSEALGFMSAWQEASGVELGESSSSPN